MPARARHATALPRRSRTLVAIWVSLVAALGLLAGCGTDLDARAANTLYACVVATDCLQGYSCVCGFCQEQGSAVQVCGEDADAADTGVADTGTADTGTADTGTADTGTADTGDANGGGCSPRTWQGCPTGQGCYADSGNKTYCVTTGSGTKGSACNPAATVPPCGMDGGKPLICDSVEKSCLPLCDTTAPDCTAGWTCYPIGTPQWPDHTGVCAP